MWVEEGGDTCTHAADSLFVQQKLTQHCKANTFPFKKIYTSILMMDLQLEKYSQLSATKKE